GFFLFGPCQAHTEISRYSEYTFTAILKIYKYIYNKKSKSQRLNPSQGKIKISPYSRFPIKEKRQNAEQVKILILACEGLTKRSAVDCPEREGLL
ncbi:hypothetical protein, partial [Pseudocitrobacter sp. 73]|uniref:hypothetical protein n=2 Tax=Enterobacteriaceae TaxID=543 RepID=UPI001CAA87AA